MAIHTNNTKPPPRKPLQRERDPIEWDSDDEFSFVEISLSNFENQLDQSDDERRDDDEESLLSYQIIPGGGDRYSCPSPMSTTTCINDHGRQYSIVATSSSVGEIESHVFQELKEYMEYLSDPSTLQQINSNFRYPPAEELQQYYAERPELASYTMKTELHRLEYTIYDHGQVVTDYDTIRTQYPKSQHDDMLFRCANQSLLADAILSLTGDDNIVRRQFLATIAANKCEFIIGVDQQFVKCYCDLLISMPLLDNVLELATLHLSVVFSPSPTNPTISAHALQLRVHDVSDSQLRSAARLLMRDIHGVILPPKRAIFCGHTDKCGMFLEARGHSSVFGCAPFVCLMTS